MIQFLKDYSSRDFYSIFWGWMFSAAGFSILLPFTAVYLSKELHLEVKQIGYFFLVTTLIRSIAQGYAGDLSDLIGRKRVIEFSLFSRFLSLLTVACLQTFSVHFYWILLFISFSYLFASIFNPVAQAAVADAVSPEQYVKGISIVRIGGNFGWVFGPILAGYLYEWDYRFLFLSSGILSLISMWIFYKYFQNTKQKIAQEEERVSFFFIFQDYRFMVFCFISLFLMIGISQFLSSLPYYLSRNQLVSEKVLGYLFSINGLTVMILQIPALKIVEKKNILLGLVLGSFLYGMAYLLVGFSNSYMGYAMVVFFISFGEVISIPLVQTFVIKLSQPDTMGRYLGFFGIISLVGWSIGPMFGTMILDKWEENSSLVWTLISIPAFISVLGYFLLFTKDHFDKKENSSSE